MSESKDIKRTPIAQVAIQEISVLQKLDEIAEMYKVDRNTLINLALKQFIKSTY